jgi:hypothetical protein
VELLSTEDKEHEEQAEGQLFSIRQRLNERYRALLAATQVDWECEAVDMLKCPFCPGTDFSDWEVYKRHSDMAEAHPAKISYCDHSGDFFPRGDALKRHCDKPAPECIGVTVDTAGYKRRETDRVFKEFKAKLERCLRTGEEIWMPFA